MSSSNIFNKCHFSQDIKLKPKNRINLKQEINKTNLLSNIKKFENDKLNKIKPKFKAFYKKLVYQEKISNEKYKDKGVSSSHSKNRNNISFFNDSQSKTKKNILLELNKIKFNIRLKRKTNTYSSYNKNIISNNDNTINKKNRVLFFNNINDNNNKNNNIRNRLLSTGENFKKLINISRNKFNSNLENKYSNNNINIIINNCSLNEHKFTIDNNKLKEKDIYNNLNKINIEKEKNYKEELIKENKKLKKELENANEQLEKYKKYRELYLNLLKKVKSNKNFVKNIKSINKDIDDNNYLNNYVNELVDRGKEIKEMLKEEEDLENNIKQLLSTIE